MEDKAKNAGKVAIVLEGGSFRGQFTAGVLDVLMEHRVEVAACYGTSAGALNGLNYKSRQIGRANRVNLAFCNDPRYMGAQSLITTGSMVGYDFMLNDVQDRLDPFDNDAYLANPMEMYACATDVMFGTAAYLPVRNATLDIDAVRASTSLPLVTQPVEIDGHLYLDGGTADSVPVEHALEDAGLTGRLWCSRRIAITSRALMGSCRLLSAHTPHIRICWRQWRIVTCATTSSASTFGNMSVRAGHLCWRRRAPLRWGMSNTMRRSCSICIFRAAKRRLPILMRYGSSWANRGWTEA